MNRANVNKSVVTYSIDFIDKRNITTSKLKTKRTKALKGEYQRELNLSSIIYNIENK